MATIDITKNSRTTTGVSNRGLSTLAKSQQSTSVGNAQGGAASSAGGTNIKPVAQIDNSAKLASDIGKMFGTGIKEHQDASEYAGKRVGNDNFVQYKKIMGDIETEYNQNPAPTAAQQLERTNTEQGVYEHFLQKGVFANNDLANEAFKATYASPAYDVTMSQRAANATNYKLLIRKETKTKAADTIKTLGASIGLENLKTLQATHNQVGLDPRDITDMYVAAAGQSWQVELNDNHNKYYDKGGNINQDAVDSKINEMYKHVLDTKDETIKGDLAKVRNTSDSFVTTKANVVKTEYTNEAIHRARSLMYDDAPYVDSVTGRDYRYATFADYEDKIDNEYPLLTTENRNQIMAMYHEATVANSKTNNALATRWLEDYNNFVKTPVDSGAAPDPEKLFTLHAQQKKLLSEHSGVTDEKKLQLEFRTERTKVVVENYSSIRTDINSFYKGDITPQDMRSYGTNGTLNTQNKTLKTGGQYQAMFKRELNSISSTLKNTDMSSEEGPATFKANMLKLTSIQFAIDGSKPKFMQDFDTNLKDKTTMSKMSYNDLKQFMAYMDYQATANPKEYSAYKSNLTTANLLMNDLDNNSELSADKKTIIARTTMKESLKWQDSNINTTKAFKDELEKYGSGTGYWATMWNTPMAGGLENTLREFYVGDYSEESLSTFFDSYNDFDIGTRYNLNPDALRILLPKNMVGAEVSANLNAIIDPIEGVSINDVTLVPYVHSSKAGGSRMLGYEVVQYSGTNGAKRIIGRINAEAYNLLKVK